MYIKILLSMCLCSAFGEQQNKANMYKDQYCTDPRTMKKHAAYTEWADAYSCTRHRCQPGGRNLAIYTVGCKRVEAPESAIECEEVVEDTNIQFPYCCTRLRCLVVVRGEVWTRVLGQPWETLPAAPWSHMYKMKKPPPGESGFVPKSNGEGPVFELASDIAARENRAGGESKNSPYHSQDSAVTENCEKATPRAAIPSPDIVIALTTSNKGKDNKGGDSPNNKANERKPYSLDDGNDELEKIELEVEDPSNAPSKAQAVSWTEIPQNQWRDDAPAMESHEVVQKKQEEKTPGFNLQSLVDAIGTRMRDIEDVVQKMSDKVHQGKKKVKQDEGSLEKDFRSIEQTEIPMKSKSPSPETENYKRFATRPHSYKYRLNEISTEKSAYVEDNNANGFFSDSSSNLMRRTQPKEPSQPTYMVPIEPQRRNMLHSVSDIEDNGDKKKKRKHKRKKTKPSRGHKKTRRKDSKVKKGKKSSTSIEVDTVNIVSLEDSAIMAS